MKLRRRHKKSWEKKHGIQGKVGGFEGQDLEVNVGFWSGSKLLVNGEPAAQGAKRGEMLLQRNDGSQVVAAWRQQMMGFDVPQLVVDGRPVKLVEPLQWYQWLWGGWPVVLVFVGGALGAIAGVLAFTVNARLFRTELNPVLKYMVTALMSGAAALAYFIVALMLSLAINR